MRGVNRSTPLVSLARGVLLQPNSLRLKSYLDGERSGLGRRKVLPVRQVVEGLGITWLGVKLMLIQVLGLIRLSAQILGRLLLALGMP